MAGTIRFLWKDGKDKALTFSYDDGQLADRRLAELFARHHMRATFHLNSGMLDKEGFVTSKELEELYRGHEIAAHGVSHPYFNQLPESMLLHELWEDRKTLERCGHQIVRGFSYPFGEYAETLMNAMKAAGLVYSRTVEATMQFGIPADFLRWHPTCHHSQVTEEMIADFLHAPKYRTLSLFYIWGHSFELAEEKDWERMETLCTRLQDKRDVWYATNGEICEYVTAVRSLVTSAEGDWFYNPTAQTLWMDIDGKVTALPPGEKAERKNSGK